LATVQTFFLRPKKPFASLRIFFLLARDATALTERGILFFFLLRDSKWLPWVAALGYSVAQI